VLSTQKLLYVTHHFIAAYGWFVPINLLFTLASDIYEKFFITVWYYPLCLQYLHQAFYSIKHNYVDLVSDNCKLTCHIGHG